MPDADDVWFEFVESRVFYKRVRELSLELLTTIQTDLVENPERGDLVEGTGGARKGRAADPFSGRGKRGSFRYLYLYLPHVGRIHLLYLYGKDEQADLSPDQKKIIAAITREIRKESEHSHESRHEKSKAEKKRDKSK
jgi:hypothetical protein